MTHDGPVNLPWLRICAKNGVILPRNNEFDLPSLLRRSSTHLFQLRARGGKIPSHPGFPRLPIRVDRPHVISHDTRSNHRCAS